MVQSRRWGTQVKRAPGLPAMKARDQAGCPGEEASLVQGLGVQACWGSRWRGEPVQGEGGLGTVSPSTWGRPDPVEEVISAGRR